MHEKNFYRLTRKQKIEEDRQFVINNIIDICREKNWDKIAVTSSSLNYRGNEKITTLLNKISNEKKLGMFFLELKPITYFAAALEKAKKCNGVVLLETYGDTYYTELDKAVSLLDENHISVAGVVIVK